MKLFLALSLFLFGLILAIVTAVQYSKAKKEQDEVSSRPYAIKIAFVFVLFVISQILLILNR